MENFEQIKNFEEKEKYTSKIELSFFRHGEKEEDSSKQDVDIALTHAGKEQALEKSETKDIKQSMAFGSKNVRAQETAGIVMSGNQEYITGEEALEELREKLDEGLAKGSKIRVDKRLDFNIDFNSKFWETANTYFKRGEYLKFLVEQSDLLAEETNDDNNFTYSKGASSVASIIDKYIKISKKWDKLVQDDKKEYSDTLERFFGTHQGVNESFLAKVIEVTKGIEYRNKFVEVLNNQGFDTTEGFDVHILNNGTDEPVVHIYYKKEIGENNDKKLLFEFDEEVSRDVIESLILK
jgi:broad specificity phosphatase PhoE